LRRNHFNATCKVADEDCQEEFLLEGFEATSGKKDNREE